ncbi:MAG: aspartate carbamoyltransferase [Methylococcales bacterium]|nr:aspartate carbamoyltransferase [Methylococcales bacterium]
MKRYALLLTGLVVFSTAAFSVEEVSPARVEEVYQRSKQVEPYNVDQAVQMFTKTVHGGVQHIVVKSADNTEQIKLIQAHLLKLSNDFSKGDFSETERIHGADMAGLAQLKLAKPFDIKFEYKALPKGVQIHYTTEYPQFAQALHEWFDAQEKEHGNQVIDEHKQHHLTPAE